jgi:alkylhydroperoxidase family enzyme
LGDPAWALREAVFNCSHLPIRIKEGVRYLISVSTECPVCLAHRSEEARSAGIGEHFYEQVTHFRESDEFDERERLALEFAYLFCYDHTAITDALFEDLVRHFSEVELFDLCVSTARHLGFGRLSQVLHLDAMCVPGLAMSEGASSL